MNQPFDDMITDSLGAVTRGHGLLGTQDLSDQLWESGQADHELHRWRDWRHPKASKGQPPGIWLCRMASLPGPFPRPAQWQRHLARIASEHVIQLTGVEPVSLDDLSARAETHLLRV